MIRENQIFIFLSIILLFTSLVPDRLFAQCPCSLFKAEFDFDRIELVTPGEPAVTAPPGALLVITVQDLPTRDDSQYAVSFGGTRTLTHLLGSMILTGVPPLSSQETEVTFAIRGETVMKFGRNSTTEKSVLYVAPILT